MARQSIREAAMRVAARAIEGQSGGGDTEAQRIARDVYGCVLAAREDANRDGAPVWALGPILYMATVGAAAIVKRFRLPADQEEDVAAYVAEGMAEVFRSVVGGFDREHFERSRAKRPA